MHSVNWGTDILEFVPSYCQRPCDRRQDNVAEQIRNNSYLPTVPKTQFQIIPYLNLRIFNTVLFIWYS